MRCRRPSATAWRASAAAWPCAPPPGASRTGARPCAQALEKTVKDEGAADEVEVFGTGCLGLCDAGPLVQVQADGETRLYEKVDPATAARIAKDDAVVRHAREGPAAGRERRVLRPAEEDRPRELRPHRSRADRVVRGRGRLRGAPEGRHRDDPARRDPADHGLGAARTGRGRLPHRPQVEHGLQGQGHAQVRHLQRRRGRPRGLHGPQRPRGRPAPGARGHGHRRLRGRGRPGLRLRARRVPARHPAPEDGDQAGGEGPVPGRPRPRHRLQLPGGHPHRRRGLRLRRGDGPHRLDRGQPRARRGPARPTRP